MSIPTHSLYITLDKTKSNLISPIPRVTVDSAEGAPAPGTVKDGREPVLEAGEPVQEHGARRLGLVQQILLADCLQHSVQQDQLIIMGN